MSRIIDLQQRIQETTALIKRMEKSVSGPSVPASVLANIRSLEKRLAMLEQDFFLLTDRKSQDVCRYRMFNVADKYKLSGFAKALADFQNLFSLTCEALKNGPKLRASVTADVEALTAFEFSYAYGGSVGVVMTLENERLLLGQTLLDETVQVVFAMARSEDSEKIATFAKRLGPAPVRALYKWASAHVGAQTGADIEWRQQERVNGGLLIQVPELERLRDAIAATSDETTQTFVYRGRLTGIDTTAKRFRFEIADGREISGSSGNVVSEGHSVVVPSNQTAKVELKTRIHYSIDKEEETWTLLDLRDESTSE